MQYLPQKRELNVRTAREREREREHLWVYGGLLLDVVALFERREVFLQVQDKTYRWAHAPNPRPSSTWCVVGGMMHKKKLHLVLLLKMGERGNSNNNNNINNSSNRSKKSLTWTNLNWSRWLNIFGLIFFLFFLS